MNPLVKISLSLPGAQKLQLAQLVADPPGTSATQARQSTTVKPERQHRPPGIVETTNPGERDKSRRSKNCQWHRLVSSWLLRTSSDVSTMSVDAGANRDETSRSGSIMVKNNRGEQEYDHYCKHCWTKSALPGQDSERDRLAEDSGSSSNDA